MLITTVKCVLLVIKWLTRLLLSVEVSDTVCLSVGKFDAKYLGN